MKYCSQCNKPFNTPGNFCPQCGNGLVEMSDEMYCPNCGQKLEAGMKFCDSCGFAIGNDQANGKVSFERETQRQRNRGKYIMAAMVVLLFLVLGGAGYYFLGRQDRSVSGTADNNFLASGVRDTIIAILPEPLIDILGVKRQTETDVNSLFKNGVTSQGLPPQTQKGNTAPVAPPAPAPVPPPPVPYNGNLGVNESTSAYIRGTYVRMRTGPGLAYNIIGHFRDGERVTVLEALEGWYKVRRANNSTGFVSSRYCIRY